MITLLFSKQDYNILHRVSFEKLNWLVSLSKMVKLSKFASPLQFKKWSKVADWLTLLTCQHFKFDTCLCAAVLSIVTAIVRKL